MSSFTDFAGSAGATTSTSGTTCVSAIGSKPLTVPKGIFFTTLGLIAGLLATSASV